MGDSMGSWQWEIRWHLASMSLISPCPFHAFLGIWREIRIIRWASHIVAATLQEVPQRKKAIEFCDRLGAKDHSELAMGWPIDALTDDV